METGTNRKTNMAGEGERQPKKRDGMRPDRDKKERQGERETASFFLIFPGSIAPQLRRT